MNHHNDYIENSES